MKVNDFFDRVFVINLDRRVDRLDSISSQLGLLDIEFERYSAVDQLEINSTGIVACATSHLNVIQLAKRREYKSILVLEDDCLFNEDFLDTFDRLSKEIPDTWDMFYLGAAEIRGTKVADRLTKIKYALGAHAYGIKDSSYDAAISVNTLDIHVDDSYLKLFGSIDAYAVDKTIVGQLPGYSDISHISVDNRHLF